MEGNKQRGFLKLFRSILDWEWYTEPETSHLFIHLCLKANYQNKGWKGRLIERGQVVTSIGHLSEQTGISIAKVRNGLKRLEKTGSIIIQTTNKYSVISIVKYDHYQEYDIENDNQITSNIQRENKQNSTTKESKKLKKEEVKNLERESNKKAKKYSRSLNNFDFLFENYKDEMEIALKKTRLPKAELEYCKAKFNQITFKENSVILFENYMKNWYRNYDRQHSFHGYQPQKTKLIK